MVTAELARPAAIWLATESAVLTGMANPTACSSERRRCPRCPCR